MISVSAIAHSGSGATLNPNGWANVYCNPVFVLTDGV